MVQWVKSFASKPDNLSLVSGMHMMEGSLPLTPTSTLEYMRQPIQIQGHVTPYTNTQLCTHSQK